MSGSVEDIPTLLTPITQFVSTALLQPYVPDASAALQHPLGLCVRADSGAADLAVAPHPAVVREQLVSLPHLRSYLADDDGGARARAWLVSKLCGNLPVDRLADVVVEVTTHDAETADAAVRAISLYTSQTDELFGDRSAIARALRDASPSAPYAERTFAKVAR